MNLAGADQKNLDMFWRFIYERQSIWYKRFILEEPKPWTTDPILNVYKFTNMYRELDRGTVFLLHNIVSTNSTLHEPIEELFNIIVYRMFNRIETYEEVGFIELKTYLPNAFRWDKARCFAIWRGMVESGRSIYTDAHMVCAYEHFPGKDKLERFEYIFDGVFLGLPHLLTVIMKAKSLSTVHKTLMKFPGIGPFLAYEIAVDISYANWNTLTEDEWVNAGPGSQRGLKFMFPGLATKDCEEMIHVLRDAQEQEFARLNLPFHEIAYKGKRLTLRNIEHNTCEAFKMFKAFYGMGRPRNKFIPHAIPGSEDFKQLKG